MDIHDLSPGVDRLRNVEAAIWAAATLVGEARRLSNERSRQQHRDRGHAINADVDLRGAFAELYLWKWVRSVDSSAAAYIKARLLVDGATGADVSGPDLRFVDRASSLGVDVKSHDCAANKKFFAVNAQKHRELRGDCDFYWCLLVPSRGKHLVVADPIPYSDVEQWETKHWQYGDPARALALPLFLESYCSGVTEPDVREIRHKVHSTEEIASIAGSSDFRAKLVTSLPTLNSFLSAT